MGNSPIVNRINALLAEKGIQKQDFYRDCGITSASYSLWNTGKTTPRKKNLDIIAAYLGTSTDYLLTGLGDKEKTPALTDKDRRDVARDVDKIMEDLSQSGDLMFDGVPMSDEARAAMAAAMRIGLEEARRRNKETYTPKKYRGG